MPNPFPKHEPYDRWLAGLTLLPEETDPSRRDAARSVAENQGGVLTANTLICIDDSEALTFAEFTEANADGDLDFDALIADLRNGRAHLIGGGASPLIAIRLAASRFTLGRGPLPSNAVPSAQTGKVA